MGSTRLRVGLLIAMVLIPAGVLLLVPAYPQPLWYHDFADQRTWLDIPHLGNVVSNLPFVIVGLWGMVFVASTRRMEAFEQPRDRWLYGFFFLAIALTGIGSDYYHSDPNNERLLWDRLPLALAFMALFALIIAERINRQAGLLLFVPLVVMGGASVVYWHFSEQANRGDLRPYLLVQLFPVVAVPFILAFFPARFTRTSDLYAALAWYAVAKMLELLDRQVYSAGQIVSGHTLKHLAAAVSPYLVLHMLQRRRPIQGITPERQASALHNA